MKTENEAEAATLQIFQRENVIWFFDYAGNPKAPHAQLTDTSESLCSDGYMNCRMVLSNPRNGELLSKMLIGQAARQKRNIGRPDWVVGSAYAAITFSYEVARLMGAQHGFVKKTPKGMVWEDLEIPEGAHVLQCEELITTLGTAFEVRSAIEAGNPHKVFFLPDVLAIVHRPKKFTNTKGMIDVVALLRREVQTWEPGECPLCAQGSPRLRPAQNWAQLTGKSSVSAGS